MKKIIIILSACVLLLGLAVLIAASNMPALFSYVLTRTAGFTIAVEKADISIGSGTVDIRLGNVKLKGPASGRLAHVAVKMSFYRGIYLQRLTIKDFDLVVGDVKMKNESFSTPVELLEISKGTVTAQKRRLFIESVVAENINTKKPLLFAASIIDPDHAGKVKVTGSSTIEKKKHHVKGTVEVDSFGLEKIDRTLGGTVYGSGEFTYLDGVLTLTGDCGSPRLSIWDTTWMKKKLIVEKVTATSTIIVRGSDVEVSVYNTAFRDAPFTILMKMKDFTFSRLEITSGFVPMKYVREHVLVEGIGYDIWDYVQDGSLKIRKITSEYKGPFKAELELKDITGVYEGKHLTDIGGMLTIEGSKGSFSGIKGAFKASTFYDFNGTIEFGEKPRIRGGGKYTIDLTHVHEFAEMKDITLHKGTAEGTVEIDSVKGKDASLGGTGKIVNTELSWKERPFSVSGAYRLSGREISFSPLHVTGKETSIDLSGKLGPKGMSAAMKGDVDVRLIEAIVGHPIKASGKAHLDGQIATNDGQVRCAGGVNMDDLAYDIPGFLRKTKNVQSRAQVKFTKKKTGEINIDELSGNLDIIGVSARGTIDPGRKIDGHVSVQAHELGRASKLFYLDEDIKGGDLSIDIAVKDLKFPLVSLPNVTGTASIKKGFIKLPGMQKAMRNIDLAAYFRGQDFDITLNGLTCGKSVLKKATLGVKGLEAPRFNLVVSMDSLDIGDFKGGKEFRIAGIKKESVLARAGGNISLRAKDCTFGKVPGKDLEINAFMTDRKINISEMKLRIFDGETDAKGMIDLSGQVPYLYTNARMAKVHAGIFMASFGSTSQDISGSGLIMGSLKTEGTTGKELAANLGGEASVYSRDGVIKKWNLLSKIFALLNVYDLVRGKIDFGKDGLSYRKMGASFTVNKGVFHTNNFLLDSTSMIITGAGDLDVNKKTIDGTLEVSPLVALDRTIDKIPVVRSILKNKNKGFLYVTYNVTGPFDDPDISTNYVGTVGTKTLEILRNILVFPKEVFEK